MRRAVKDILALTVCDLARNASRVRVHGTGERPVCALTRHDADHNAAYSPQSNRSEAFVGTFKRDFIRGNSVMPSRCWRSWGTGSRTTAPAPHSALGIAEPGRLPGG